ncbi:hypothetical protein [Myroides sp.]|uniref:hypothetical protein n=1 Tax=Myroides sp. TaxID=1874736 RepID=UPI003F39AA7B
MYDTLTTLLQVIENSNTQPEVLINFKTNQLIVKREKEDYTCSISEYSLSKAIEELEPII